MKISTGVFQHGFRLGAQAVGDRAMISQREVIQKRVWAQRAYARATPEDSGNGFLSLHT